MLAGSQQSAMLVSDDPQSKIRFMEQTLDGKAWRTRIAYPDTSPDSMQKREEISRSLKKQGYRVHEIIDAQGYPALDVIHDAIGTRFTDLVREMGLLQGTLHTIAHPGVAVGEVMRSSHQLAQKFSDSIKDPARANGLIFIAAEMFLASAGLFNKEKEKLTFWQKIKQPRNALHSLAGLLWLSQSLVYFFLARSNEEIALEAIQKKTVNLSNGQEPEPILYDSEKDAPKQDIISKTQRFIQKYPIQIGAMANNLGMLSFMGHAIYNRRYHLSEPLGSDSIKYVKKGFWFDIGGALTSLVAWSLLLIPSHQKTEHEEKTTKPADSIFGRIWQNFKENPEHGTGLLTIASSTQRLVGASMKKNWVHVTGEALYLPGDFLLLFTKNGEYGDHKNLNTEKLAAKLSEHIQRQPVILGKAAQTNMVKEFADYLFEKAKADNTLKAPKNQITLEVMQSRRDMLIQATERKLRHSQNEKLERMTDALAAIITKLPEASQVQATTNLATALSNMPAIAVTADEMHAMLAQSLREKYNNAEENALPSSSAIKKETIGLAKSVPEQVADKVVGIVYDVLARLQTPQSFETSPLNKTSLATDPKQTITAQGATTELMHPEALKLA